MCRSFYPKKSNYMTFQTIILSMNILYTLKKIYEFQLPYPFAKTIFGSKSDYTSIFYVLYIHVRMGKNCIIREVFFFQMNNNNSHQTKKHIRLRFLFDNGALNDVPCTYHYNGCHCCHCITIQKIMILHVK